MSGFRNKTAKFRYVNPEWEDGSSWTLFAELTDDSTEAIEALTRTYTVTNIDDSELKAAAKRGENVRDIIAKHVEPVVLLSGKRATLLHMSVAWEGEHFTFPEDFTAEDPQGNEIPHPEAGKLGALTAENIGLLSTEDVDAVYWTMSKVWAGAERSPEEQKEFRGKPVGASSKSRSTGKAKIPESAAAD